MACSTRCVSDVGVFVPQPMNLWNAPEGEGDSINSNDSQEQENGLHRKGKDISVDHCDHSDPFPEKSARESCTGMDNKQSTEISSIGATFSTNECTDDNSLAPVNEYKLSQQETSKLNTSHLVEMPDVDEDTCAICLDEFTEDDPAQETECGYDSTGRSCLHEYP